MNAENNGVSITLSQEELVAVLATLQTSTIPGLDTSFTEEWSDEQRQWIMSTAIHGLRARGLATVRADGVLMLHRVLLTAVGVCAYSHSAAVVYHWSPTAVEPTQFYGHIRGEDVVAHTQFDSVLHRFSLVHSRERLIDHLLAACEYQPPAMNARFEFRVSSDTFTASREHAEQQKTQAATNILAANGVNTDAADAFVQTLANMPQVSIVQTLKQQSATQSQARQFTVIQTEYYGWRVEPVNGSDNSPLDVRTTNNGSLRAWLAESV